MSAPKQVQEYDKEKFLKAAEQYFNEGLTIIPLNYPRYVGDDDAKKPAFDIFKNEGWQKYQNERASLDEIKAWFSTAHNVAVVCGSVSGNLAVIDIDDGETARKIAKKIEDAGLKELLETRFVRSGKGVHIYYWITGGTVKTSIRATDEVDIKGEGGYVVAPPSVHPNGNEYRSNSREVLKISKEGFKKILEAIGVNKRKIADLLDETIPHEMTATSEGEELKRLSDEEINQIVNLISPYYNEGYRHLLSLYISGWLAKAKVNPVSCARILKRLHDEKNDGENRMPQLVYSYARQGIDISKYEAEIEAATGVRISTLPHVTEEEEVKGISGIHDVIESQTKPPNPEEVERVVKELEKITLSFRSINEFVSVPIDIGRRIYAIADEENLYVVKATTDEHGRIRNVNEIIFEGAPVKVVAYENPLGGPRLYEIEWFSKSMKRQRHIEASTVEEILDYLKANGLVANRNLAGDVIGRLLDAYILAGKAELKEEVNRPGFFWFNNKLVVSGYEIKKVSVEDLKAALELLNELATKWFSQMIDKFVTVITWSLYAPFIFVRKQKELPFVEWLYLYGASKTGKTTLGKIGLSFWGVQNQNEIMGSSIDTVPRLGTTLSSSTFPYLVNEPGSAIKREDIVETLKSAIEGKIVRSKHTGSSAASYIRIPSYASLIFASNKAYPTDDALARRLLVLHFTWGERVSDERAQAFENEIKPKLKLLSAIGNYIAKRVAENPDLVDINWRIFGKQMLNEMFRAAGLELSAWIEQNYEEERDIKEELKEAIKDFLIERINGAYSRNIGKIYVNEGEDAREKMRVEVNLEERAKIVLEENYIPWAFMKNNEVRIGTGILGELREGIGEIGNLKSLSELLGWGVDKKKVTEQNTVRMFILVQFNNFISFLTDWEEGQ